MTTEAPAVSRAPVMEIRPIRTDADHRWALREVDADFTTEPEVGSPGGDRFEVLLALIGAYGAEHDPIPPVDPVEILACRDRGPGPVANGACGAAGLPRASAILNRKRVSSLAQIRTASAARRLPIALLAAPYRLARDAA